MAPALSANLKYGSRILSMAFRPACYQHIKILNVPAHIRMHSFYTKSSQNSFFTNRLQKHQSTFSPTAVNSALHVESVNVYPGERICCIKWEDGFKTEFHSVWLRHNCHCEACRHRNGQRLLDPAMVQSSIYIDSVSTEGNTLKVSWRGLDSHHQGHIPFSYLRAHNYNMETMLAKRQAVKCDKAVLKIPTTTYDEITASKDGLLKWLQQINEDGISIVTDVPTEDSQVAKVAELVGPVATTIYGTTFDVKVTEDPINVAYSDVHIGLHMDLVYYESPPGLQLLHCLKFDKCIEGGESIFLDAFTIADEFRVNYPDLFHTLTRVPATFQKVHYDRDYPVHIVNQKPHIRLNHFDEIVAVYWAPPFEGPLSVVGDDVESYYRAYEVFAKSLTDSPYLLKHRLKPGELVVFNNLRMLHGRSHFKSNGGMRHLKGCYVNIDIFKSMTQVMNNLVGDGRLAKRVGNQCWF